MSSILFKAEDAIHGLILNGPGLAGVGLHRGSENEELTLPYIAMLAETSEERQPRGSGNYSVNVKIELFTSSDDKTRDQRIALTDALIELLSEDGLSVTMSQYAQDFRVFGVLMGGHGQKILGRSHCYTIDIQLHCCNSDV